MRRAAVVALVVVGMLLLPARASDAQVFWRWFEKLSGPKVSGPGFDVALLCRAGDERDASAHWFVSPQCADASRARPWISAGIQFYALAGDNDQTAAENDRVDAIGVLPFIDVNLGRGTAVGVGLGVRRYWAASGAFNKPDIETMVKLRPFVAVSGRDGSRAAPSFPLDLIEVRVALVFHRGFDAGQFGPDAPAIGAEVRPVFFVVLNLLK